MPRRERRPNRSDVRAIQVIQLDADAQGRLDLFVKGQGMTHVTVLSNVVQWFTSLPPHLQNELLRADGKEAAAERYLHWLKQRKP